VGAVTLFVVPATALGLRSAGAGPTFLGAPAVRGRVAHPLRGLPARSTELSKLDSNLRALVAPPQSFFLRGHPVGAAAPRLVHGKVRVQVTATNVPAVRAAIARLGGHVEGVWHSDVFGLVPPRSLAALSRLPAVGFVGTPASLVEDAVPGEEVGASLASAWQAQGVTGKGVKVAVIDGGFGGLADRQASGDLPTNIVTADFCDGQFGSTDEIHGTAVTEIVHEMAPDAQLYLACTTDAFSVSQAEQWAQSHGVKVINFSAGFPAASRGDGSGFVDSIAAAARASGILWVNAAGNAAQTHWAGPFTDTNADTFHEWSGSDSANRVIWPRGASICGFLTWDEWPNAKSDFALVLLDPASGTVLAESDTAQTGSQPPVERLCTTPNLTGSNVVAAWAVIGHRVVGTPRLDFTGDSPPLQYSVPADSIVDPATSPGAFAVGALCWQTGTLEPYSSQGPTIDGRVKPDIAGHDSVSGATYGAFVGSCPSGFAGTSAASPEVAGAAALVKQAQPSFGPNELQSFLERNATDVGAPGPDDQTGAGALHLPSTVIVADTTPPKAKALASSGRRGHLVKLLFRVSDNSGQVKIREQVKRNGRVIATVTTAFLSSLSTLSARTDFVTWKAPASIINGSVQHCVRGQDRAGNVSPISCARVTLSG
jgi:subtilisin family serine protease